MEWVQLAAPRMHTKKEIVLISSAVKDTLAAISRSQYHDFLLLLLFKGWNKILSFSGKYTPAHALRHTQFPCIVRQCTGKELNSIRLQAGQP